MKCQDKLRQFSMAASFAKVKNWRMPISRKQAVNECRALVGQLLLDTSENCLGIAGVAFLDVSNRPSKYLEISSC